MPPPSFRDYRLPSGRHGLTPAQVAENQRLRLIGAGSDLLAEGRLPGLTSRLICRRAGVSGHTFYEHFANVDALLVAAFANAAQLLVELIAGACTGRADRGERIQKALAAAVCLGGEEHGFAALFRIEVAVAIPEVGAERERMLARLSALAAGRRPETDRCTAIAAAFALAVDQLEGKALGATASIGGELTALLG
jgi:AcrR family transcriptional regulator